MTPHSLADEAVMVADSRRNAAARLHDAEEEGRADVAYMAFLYRDALLAQLIAAREERLARSLSSSEIEMMKCVAIHLWGEYARAHHIDVRLVTREQHALLVRANAAKAAAQQATQRTISLRQLQREIDTLLPGQTTTPTNNRKLERRSY